MISMSNINYAPAFLNRQSFEEWKQVPNENEMAMQLKLAENMVNDVFARNKSTAIILGTRGCGIEQLIDDIRSDWHAKGRPSIYCKSNSKKELLDALSNGDDKHPIILEISNEILNKDSTYNLIYEAFNKSETDKIGSAIKSNLKNTSSSVPLILITNMRLATTSGKVRKRLETLLDLTSNVQMTHDRKYHYEWTVYRALSSPILSQFKLNQKLYKPSLDIIKNALNWFTENYYKLKDVSDKTLLIITEIFTRQKYVDDMSDSLLKLELSALCNKNALYKTPPISSDWKTLKLEFSRS